MSVPAGLSVPFPGVPLEGPHSSTPVPTLNPSPPDEGQPQSSLPDVPLFHATVPNNLLANTTPPDSPLLTLSPPQRPLYVTHPTAPLPDNPLPAVPPKETGFDDPSTGVSLVEVLTPDKLSPAVPGPDLPLLAISPEVPRLDETPPDPLPTHPSPVDVLTPDVSPSKVPLDIVPGARSSESPDNLSEPPLDEVPADVSVESLLSPSELGRSNALPDNTIDQPGSGKDLASVEFSFPFLEESVNPGLDSVPELIDDPQNFPDDSRAPADSLESNLLDSGQNYGLGQLNTDEKVNGETGSPGLISSTQNNGSKDEEPDSTQAVQVERQSSTLGPTQESDQNKGAEDKTQEEQQEKGTKSNSNGSAFSGMMYLKK